LCHFHLPEDYFPYHQSHEDKKDDLTSFPASDSHRLRLKTVGNPLLVFPKYYSFPCWCPHQQVAEMSRGV
jgi:hypothetical protein